MIPYIELRDKYTYKAVAMVEPHECWLELSYNDVGEFEIYCLASPNNLKALQKGRYVTIPNKPYIWVITSVQYTFTAGGARMISARGYEAKWLLHKRCILTPKEKNGTFSTVIYGLVNDNMGGTLDDTNPRKIKGFTTDTNTLGGTLNEQVPRGNLLEFITSLLKAYGYGHIATFENGVIKYKVIQGDNKKQSVRFSQSLDNLLASEYLTDDANLATFALVVSTVDDVDYVQNTDDDTGGVDRAEIIVESNLSTKYEDVNGNERELLIATNATDLATYKWWLEKEGDLKLAEHLTADEASGEIDLANSHYTFAEDFFIGDLVTLQDEYFNFNKLVRINKYTFKQDANGYGEEAEYGG